MSLKDRIKQASDLLERIAEIPQPPALGLDLDGTITDAPEFFSMLAKTWDGPVYIITYRNHQEKAEEDAAKLGVKASVVLVNSFEEKAVKIKELNIKVFFDDMDEVITHIPEDVMVFKVRNGGNFDFSDGKWLYDKKTGKEC